MAKMTILEGNSNDKDNVRAFMVKGEKGDPGVSPTFETRRTARGGIIEITDVEGTEELELYDGESYEIPTNGVIGWASEDTIPGGYEEINCGKVPTFFNSVAEMKAGTLSVGDIVETLGYYEANDGGKGLYLVTDDNTLIADNGFIIDLNNGLKATLIAKNKINIKQLGAKGDGETDDTNAFSLFVNSNYKKLIIPEGTYNITDILNISNKEIIGINKPTINCISQTTSREHQIQLNNSCILNNVKFVQNHQTSLMGLFNCYDTIIKNCELKVNNYKTNGYLDLYTNNRNITIENNIFDCYSAEQGGGIWIREFNSELTSSNIIFSNNKFKHFSSDEVIGVWNWKGKVKNVIIDNNIFEDYENAKSPHFITLAVDELIFSNNIIYRNGIVASGSENMSIIKSYYNTDFAKPLIVNCKFYLNTPLYTSVFNGGTPIVKNCEIYNKFNCKINDGTSAENAKFDGCYFEIEKFQLIKGIFKNCTFKCTNNDTSIQQYGQVSRGNIELYDCIFIDMIFRGFFFQAFSANDSIVMNNVKFKNPDVTNLTSGNFISNGSNAVYTDIRNSDILGKIAGGNSIGYVLNNYLWQALTEFSGIKYNNNYVIV